MKGKVAFSVLSTAFMFSLFMGTAYAEENNDTAQTPDFIVVEPSNSFTLSKTEGLDTGKDSIMSLLPKSVKRTLSSNSNGGFTPFFFPTEAVDLVVEDGKVVEEVHLMAEPQSESEVQKILEEGSQIILIEEVKDFKEGKTWYKVKVSETIEVEVEGEKGSKTIDTIGYIAPEYIHLIDTETQEKIQTKEQQILEENKQSLLEEVKQTVEMKKEEERKALEEKLRLEKEKKLEEEREQEALLKQRAKPVEAKVTVANTGGASSSVIETAKQFMGVKYVFGAAPGRTDAFDCSSFTQYVFKQHGISLPRTAATQFQKGVSVSKDNLQPGDMVFFETYKAGASHVGIYIGGGNFIHASSVSGVTITSLSKDYYVQHYLGARRVM